MDLIPVLDLLDGRVVHGKKGERDKYIPVESVLTNTAEPLDVARAFRDSLDLKKFYIADLDSIQGKGDNTNIIEELSRLDGVELMVDSGWSSGEDLDERVIEAVDRIILGTENLDSMDFVRRILENYGEDKVVLSVDMEAGELLTDISGLESPEEAVERFSNMGFRKFILLDLRRVGSEEGVNSDVEKIIRKFPDLDIITGGGIRDSKDAIKLFEEGFEGLLIATAFHNGNIGYEEVEKIRKKL